MTPSSRHFPGGEGKKKKGGRTCAHVAHAFNISTSAKEKKGGREKSRLFYGQYAIDERKGRDCVDS